MRLLSVLPLGVVACLPLLTSAGFLDRLRGGGSPSSVDAPAAPSPPSEPSLDAFGGSAAGHAAAAAVVGQPTLSGGQPAVKTANAVPVQQPVQPVEPFDGIEWRTKYYVVRTCKRDFKGRAADAARPDPSIGAQGGSLHSVSAFSLLLLLVTDTLLTRSRSFAFSLAITALVTLALLGKARNKAQALSWWKANISVLGGQFSSFTSKPASASLTRGDPSTFLAYASGRRNVSLCTVKIRTLRWHDLPSMLFECGYRLYDLSRIGEDGSVALEFDLPAASNGGGEFVWALVRRHAMQELREARFDLQAFTSIVEPPKDLLPNEEFVVFSEQGVLNEIFLGSKRADRVGFRELLDPKNAQAKKALKWLRAIIIGDVVSDRPDEA